MAIICRSHKLIFVMTPRTACTAIGNLLFDKFGGEFLPGKDILDSQGRILCEKKHSTLGDIIRTNVMDEQELAGYVKFAAVRNPFDSLVSLYLKKKHQYQPLLADTESWVHRKPRYAKEMIYCTNHSFNQWVFRYCRRRAIKRTFGINSSMFDRFTQGLDYIMRYENIADDLNEVLSKAGFTERYEIPRANKTQVRKNVPYQEYYTPMTRRLVQYAFAYDLKKYNYSFDADTKI